MPDDAFPTVGPSGLSVAASMPAGSMVEVMVRGTLVDGTPWELKATIEISDDDDDDDEDDDDDGKNTVDPAVAAQAIADLQGVIDYIDGLVAAGTMDANAAKPLITKLQSAIASLQKLNGNPAVNNLESFLNQLESSEKTGKILEVDAEYIEDLYPGRYPMLMRNSPVISPPVKRRVFLNRRTQLSFDLGWWDASHSAKEP